MDSEKSKTRRKWPGWISLAILAISLLPVVGAWWFLQKWQEGGEFEVGNYGELIVPARPLKETTLKTLEGKALTVSELKGKWTLVIFGPAKCNEICQQNLYETRQIRLATGQDMRRVQRLWLTDDVNSVGNQEWLKEQHPDLLIASEGESRVGFVDQFVLPKVPDPLAAQRVYIIDPIGNLMISYPPEEAPEHILDDLNRLLFVSHIG